MRYLILLSALVMQMCLGATYSWSVYVHPLKELTSLAQGPVQLPFTIFYFVFPFTMMIAGNFLPRIGTRTSAMIGGRLITTAGFTPFETFLTFGVAFMTLVFMAGSTMKVPEENTTETPTALNPKTVLSHINFRILYMAMFIGLAAGFAVNANLKELYQGVGNATLGITAVSLFAIANAAGRILWGALFDRISSSSAIFANLICQAGILLMAPF